MGNPAATTTRIKVSIVGPSGVGKTQLVHRHRYNTFCADHVPTVGIDYVSWTTPDCKLSLGVWDASGNSRFRSISCSYLKAAHALIFVFDLNRRDTLIDLDNFVTETEQLSSEARVRLLVGTKLDLGACAVSDSDIERFTQRHRIDAFYPCSARTGTNVNLMFAGLVDRLSVPDDDKSTTTTTTNDQKIDVWAVIMSYVSSSCGGCVR